MQALSRSIPLALVLALAALGGCKKDDEAAAGLAKAESAPESFEAQGAVTEQHDDATIAWVVTPEGKAYARVDRDGKAVPASQLKGSVKVLALGGDGKPVEHKLEDKGGLLHAEVGKLEAPLTTVSYDIELDGKPLRGSLHVPRGGTKPLVEGADVAAKAGVEAGAKGPHGGVVQVVGKHVVEIVGQKGTGEVRVYLLDDAKKPVVVKTEKVGLAVTVSGGATEIVELEVEPKKRYFVAKLDVRTDPHKMTVVVEDGPDVHVAIVGHAPGRVFVVGRAAPTIGLYVVRSWDVVVVDRPGVIFVKGKGKGWKKGKGRGRGGVFIKIH